jgi:hypothetical protein
MRSLRGLLSPSSCRNQLTNGFELVKIKSTNLRSWRANLPAIPDAQVKTGQTLSGSFGARERGVRL